MVIIKGITTIIVMVTSAHPRDGDRLKDCLRGLTVPGMMNILIMVGATVYTISVLFMKAEIFVFEIWFPIIIIVSLIKLIKFCFCFCKL